MSVPLSSSKQSTVFLLRLCLLKPQTPAIPYYPLHRHLSTEPNPPPQPPPLDEESLINEAVQLFQALEDGNSSSTQLHQLLFTSSSPSSPGIFRQITRRLASSSQALEFFDYIRSNSPSQELTSLTFPFEAIFELARREPDPQNKLLELYRTSKERNIPLTVNGATLLVRCLGRAERVDEALAVVDDLDPSLKNTHFYNVVVAVLFRSGRFVEALNMLDEMLQPGADCPPNDITGHVVFAALSSREWFGRSISDEEIVGLVSKLLEHGVFPDTFKLMQLITKLCRNKKIGRAWDVLHDVMKAGGTLEAASCNALLMGLGRDGDFERMNTLMTEMKAMDIQPNVVTFGILINHMCKSRRVDEALEVFEKMKGMRSENKCMPNTVTYNCLIDRFCKAGEIERAQELFDQMNKERVFEKMIGGNDGFSVEPNVITYNTLIDGLCKVGRQEEGLTLLHQMRSENKCMPDTVTYNCLIDGFCKAGKIERAQELFDQMNKERVFPNVITLTTLVGGDAVTFSILINAFCNANNIDKAMELFNQMSKDGCSPGAIVFYRLISGLSKAGRMDDASSVVSMLKEAGFCLDIVRYNVLIGGFCRKNKLDKAYEMLKEMEQAGVKSDIVTYNTLISYLSKAGNFATAHRVMRNMIKEGLVPTVVTYRVLIRAYCLNGKIEEAMKIFRDMSSSSKVPPDNNEVELALSLMDEMKVEGVRPNVTTYNAMFKGLREKNFLEKAFDLMDRMVEEACNPDYITMDVLTEWLPAVGETGKLKKFVNGYEVSVSTS
ncbi:hypothetical protein CIPAW_01G067100 [Carya illinoinensis]|uniref:Pentatricopeptide repeat-containing protein n=1 Tax=Carya illinoinensis TaxID=32201 RepID=A0A8T1RJY4_CARIL|nr:hypothetical protein CIPAW_01G067100 [Carya illinoinensis]